MRRMVWRSRYGYVGGHGYESGMIALYGENEGLPAVTLVHVGERWYEPGTGRFVQRDPIGLRGGLNVYGYCGGQPLVCVDPSGLQYYPPWYPPELPPITRLSPSAAKHRWLTPHPRLGGYVKDLPRVLWRTPIGKTIPYVGLCAVVADLSYKAGRLGDNIVKKAAGKSVSEWLGEKAWKWFWPKPGNLDPGYQPY